MNERARSIVIVGGGVTGLAAAHALGKLLPEGRARITVLEARPRLGGNITTDRENGFVVDAGPDAWVSNKPDATILAKELGLEGELVSTVAANRRVYIAWNGALHPMPEGLVLGIPTELRPFLETPLLSLEGKLRAGFDLFVPKRRFFGEEDESVGHFVARRLGEEVADRLVGPLLGGIFAGDAYSISVRAAFPSLVDAEAKHGSLIVAMRAQRRAGGARQRPAPSAFVSLRSGMGALIDALARAVQPRADVRTGVDVVDVRRAEASRAGGPRFHVALASGEVLAADDVLFAVPTRVAAKLTRGLDAQLSDALDALLGYASTAAVFLALPRDAVKHPLDATGFIAPRAAGEDRALIAATFVTSKWEARAPEGFALFRAFLGGANIDALLERDDADLVDLAKRELAAFVPFEGAPIMTRVHRHRLASPQPTIGHATRKARLDARLAEVPGVHVAASGVLGVGIPDCIKQATTAAARIAGG